MAKNLPPRVYVDACVFLNVIKKEPGLWFDSLKLLYAAERGDIQLVASTFLIVEVGSHKGDIDPAARDDVIRRYLENLDVEWAEVDLFTAMEARKVGDTHKLRGADALHLTTAIRRRANYFVSRDKEFPYNETIDGVQVVHPSVLWSPTVDDELLDKEAAAEAASRQASAAPPS